MTAPREKWPAAERRRLGRPAERGPAPARKRLPKTRPWPARAARFCGGFTVLWFAWLCLFICINSWFLFFKVKFLS